MSKNGWLVISLGEVVKISKGKKLNSLVDYKTPSSKRFIQIDDLRNNEKLKYTEDNSGVLANEKDVLIAWDGANAGTVGFGVEGFIGSTIARLELLDEKISTYYLGWLLRTKSKYLRDNCTGATIPHINKSVLESLKIPLPPLPIQKQIAEILEKADQAKQKRNEAKKLTDEFLQSVFIEMFGDPVKNPKRWVRKTLTEIISSGKYSLKRGPFGSSLRKDIFTKSGYLVYEQFHALNNDFTFQRYFIDEHKYRELEMFSVSEGDLIVSCSGVYLGKIAIVPKGSPAGIINQALLKISLDKSKVSNIYFIYLWNTHLIQKILSLVSRGSGIPNFPSMSEIKQILFPVPPLSLQQQFAEIVNKTEALKEKQKQSEQELENLFQSLMQRAFKGELVS